MKIVRTILVKKTVCTAIIHIVLLLLFHIKYHIVLFFHESETNFLLLKSLDFYFGHLVKACSIFYLHLDTKHCMDNQKRMDYSSLVKEY